ncbi:MAG: DUF302 domain-containing protein [Hydrogenovibrio crunogenus]|uniref:DUF302 domain-containing protein n=1 Tax=Hydrogenovibrio crunogenus (strain DSM 25203 / XCL-2) TaxID=317025 RepID=Q31EH7_HYDCU|nr:DUF302 domain-containing protein [Hydrogenovibrio crunogenus]
MYYQVESGKNFEQAVLDVETAVKNHNFGVLHVHDLGNTLRSKGVEFKEDCKVFEICNPHKASQVLEIDMRLNMALPCRVSVYTENNQTKIGMIEPQKVLSLLSSNNVLNEIAQAVQDEVIKIIEEAK